MKNFTLIMTLLCTSIVYGGIHDTLPKSRYYRTIGDMKLNETCWVTPWSMVIDVDGYGWLRQDVTVYKDHQGATCMKINKRKDGFHVDLTYCDHKWSKYRHTDFAEPQYVKVRYIIDITPDDY